MVIALRQRRQLIYLYARQLCGLLDHLQIDKAAIVGFSIGGMINRRFALDYADRLSALAILNSPHDRGDEAQALVEARAAAVRDQKGRWPPWKPRLNAGLPTIIEPQTQIL